MRILTTLTAAAALAALAAPAFAQDAEPDLTCDTSSYEPIACVTPDGIALDLWGPFDPSEPDEPETGLNAAAMQVLSGYTPEDIAKLPKRSTANGLLVVRNVQLMDDDDKVIIWSINVSADFIGAWQWFRADTGEPVGPKHCFGADFKRFCHGQDLAEFGLPE